MSFSGSKKRKQNQSAFGNKRQKNFEQGYSDDFSYNNSAPTSTKRMNEYASFDQGGHFDRPRKQYNNANRYSHPQNRYNEFGRNDFHSDRGNDQFSQPSYVGQNQDTKAAPVPLDLKFYLQNLVEPLESSTDENETELIINKCLQECRLNEFPLVLDINSCQTLEALATVSGVFAARFLSQLLETERRCLRRALINGCASRFIETSLYQLRSGLTDSKSKNRDLYWGVLEGIGSLLLEEFDACASHIYGTHILRAYGRLLCGLGKPPERKKETGERHPKMEDSSNTVVKVNLTVTLKRLIAAIIWKVLDYKEMGLSVKDEHTSLLLQEYIRFDNLCKTGAFEKFLIDIENDQTTYITFQWKNKQASRLWEEILKTCELDYLESIYAKHLKSNLSDLAMHNFANFPVQRFLERCRGDLAKVVLKDLKPKFDSLWQSFGGVCLSLMVLGKNNNCLQKACVQTLLKTIKCVKQTRNCYLVPVLLHMTTYDVWTKEMNQEMQETMSIHGSRILQCLLEYDDTQLVVDSLLSLTAVQLCTLACNPCGTFLLETFLKSSLPENTKMELYEKLKGNFVALACDSRGNWVVECYWDLLNKKGKLGLAKELTALPSMDSESMQAPLRQSPWGKRLEQKLDLRLYERSPRDWIKRVLGRNKAKK